MMALPLQVDPISFDLFIVLEDDNIERIKAYDPAQMIKANLAAPFNILRIRNVLILYASAEEARILSSVATQKDLITQLKRLTRGWKFQPKRGDFDGPSQSPAKN